MRPLCAFRNFVFFGCIMALSPQPFRNFLGRSVIATGRTSALAFGHLLVLGHRIVLEDLALEDPDLDTAGAEGRERGRNAVVDVGAQRVQRHATFAIPLHARDFRTAQTTRAVDADAFGAETHRRLNGALHGAAERDATLELLRDRLGHQRRIELRLADFDDVDDDVGRGDVRDLLAKLVDVGALLADHHARTSRVNGDAALLVRTLDHDAGDRRLLELLVQDLADLDILVQQLAVFLLAGEPAGIPGPVDAETQTDRIDLLTHRVLLRPLGRCFGFDLTNDNRQLRKWFENTARAATAAGGEALHHDTVADEGLRHDEIINVE